MTIRLLSLQELLSQTTSVATSSCVTNISDITVFWKQNTHQHFPWNYCACVCTRVLSCGHACVLLCDIECLGHTERCVRRCHIVPCGHIALYLKETHYVVGHST